MQVPGFADSHSDVRLPLCPLVWLIAVRYSAQEDTCLSLATPVQGPNGEQITQVPIPKGTPVHVSIVGSNRNARLWGLDAEEWKPERWLQPLPDALVDAKIPGVYSHL